MTDMDDAFRKEFEVDPNEPKPADLLDVLQEASQRHEASKKAAIEMQAAIAIRALLDGADVREVARKCGFDLSTGGGGQDEVHVVGITGSFYEMIMGTPQQHDQTAQFVSWLTSSLSAIVKQKLEEAAK